MADAKRQAVTGNNYWAFSGNVTKKDMKYSGDGNAFISLMLRIPSKNPKFTTIVFLKAFKEMAEELNEAINDGGDYSFSGYLSKSSYMKGEQKVYQDNYIVTKHEPAIKADFDVPAPKDSEAPVLVDGGKLKKEKIPF